MEHFFAVSPSCGGGMYEDFLEAWENLETDVSATREHAAADDVAISFVELPFVFGLFVLLVTDIEDLDVIFVCNVGEDVGQEMGGVSLGDALHVWSCEAIYPSKFGGLERVLVNRF